MRKQIIYACMAALLMLTGCEDFNEKHFDGLEGLGEPTDVKNLDYTLTKADYEAMGGKPKTNLYFSAADPADNFIPDWLSDKYMAASATSVVRVTFDYLNEASELLKPYTGIEYKGLEKNEDYTPFYGEGYYAPYLNQTSEANIITQLLNVKYPDAKKNDLVMVGYNYNETAVPQQMEEPVKSYNFEDLKSGNVTSIKDWYVSAPADKSWTASNYNKNTYISYSAFSTKGEVVAWLVTPGVKIEGVDKKFAFDVAVGRWNSDCLSVLISTDFDGKDINKAVWKDVTTTFTFEKKTDGYSDMTTAGIYELNEYAGKTVYVAFKYVGDGTQNKTTTYQIDNIVFGKDIPKVVNVSPRFKLFLAVKDKQWSEFSQNPEKRVYCPGIGVYTEMGAPAENMYFSSAVKPEAYMPVYLSKMIAYPVDKQAAVTICRYNNGKSLEALAKEYIYSSETGLWTLNTQIVEKTRQYAFNGAKWLFDPSVTVTLGAKGDKPTAAFYQAVTDWVKENKGKEYVTSFGNNDYYYGGSAYQNNFDFRPAKWREQNNAVYGTMSDEDLTALMYGRLPEAFLPGLETTYPNVEPMDGVKVIYTVKFSVYDADDTKAWSIQYEVTAKGKFTYVADSLKEEE